MLSSITINKEWTCSLLCNAGGKGSQRDNKRGDYLMHIFIFFSYCGRMQTLQWNNYKCVCSPTSGKTRCLVTSKSIVLGNIQYSTVGVKLGYLLYLLTKVLELHMIYSIDDKHSVISLCLKSLNLIKGQSFVQYTYVVALNEFWRVWHLDVRRHQYLLRWCSAFGSLPSRLQQVKNMLGWI